MAEATGCYTCRAETQDGIQGLTLQPNDGAPSRRYAQPTASGDEMFALIRELYPICRSITGNGVRETLRAVRARLPIDIREVASGTQVFDWTVPREWNIRDAWIADRSGKRVVDFRAHNLHVLNYSTPIRRRVPIEELRAHLFSLPEHPDWIPYRTSYYTENWGFCVSHRQLEALTEPYYDVCIDSELADGHLTYGEFLLEGETEEEVLISCHVCHPSLCNDNLSGIALSTWLGRALLERAKSGRRSRYSYRFLFIPGTIGSITWLALNEARAKRICHGLVVVCVGDPGPFTYKKSRRGDTEIDRVVQNVLGARGEPFKRVDFYPYGYDERQYCSPGFDLAVGSLSRSSHGDFPEYHTSADNLEFVSQASLEESLATYLEIVDALEGNRTFVNLSPKCEPQLGKRGLYGSVGATGQPLDTMTLLWVLNLADGSRSLLDIAERAGLGITSVRAAADALVGAGLLAELP
jgi:aminopeptidase-like protein